MDTYLPCIYMGNPEVLVGKLMLRLIRAIPFGALQKIWAVISCVFFFFAIFLLFLVCSADLDVHRSESSSQPRQIL